MPKFDGDKAYALVEKQLSFGHRIPGTLEHKATKDWYVEQLKAAVEAEKMLFRKTRKLLHHKLEQVS